jgi:hypothetical protein
LDGDGSTVTNFTASRELNGGSGNEEKKKTATSPAYIGPGKEWSGGRRHHDPAQVVGRARWPENAREDPRRCRRPRERRGKRKTEHVGYCSINTTSFFHFSVFFKLLPNLHSNFKISKNKSCSTSRDLQLCFLDQTHILNSF